MRVRSALATLLVSGTVLSAIPAIAQDQIPQPPTQAPAALNPAAQAPSDPSILPSSPAKAPAEKPGSGASGGESSGAGADALKPGRNSFTQDQARARIEASGYSDVGELKLDEQSIWRGTASKNGKTGSVGLDYRGMVVDSDRL